VTDFLHTPLSEEEDEKLLDEFDPGEVFSDPEQRFELPDTVQATDKNRVLLVCVIVSLLIHFGLAYAIPRIVGIPKPDMSGREVIQPVRIVQQPASIPEPPPENAAAISDHNHTAEKERMPLIPPSDKPPLGTPQQMASLAPPPAPEVSKPIEEPKPKPEAKPQQQPEKKVENRKPKPSHSKEVSKPRPTQTKETARQRHQKRNPQLADLMPRASDYETAFGPPGGVQDFDPRGNPDEVVVDLNAREDNKYYSYLLYLKQKIQGVWVYPRAAAQAGTEGSLVIEFSIAKNGELLFVNLLDSSGHTILDTSAMNAIQQAAPYEPLPPRLRAKRLRIRANFIYVTKRSFFGRIM
jgi:protein TonB